MQTTPLRPALDSLSCLIAMLFLLAATGCGWGGAPGESTEPAAEVPEVTEVGEAGAERVQVDPPAGPGAMAPRVSAATGAGVWTSWLEPVQGPSEEEAPVYRLRAARFDGEAWNEPVTVTTGTSENPFFANWADTPGVVEGTGGEMLAHWLAKTGEATYAYAIFLARSTDGGATWRELGTLHDDSTPTEHGFVSLLAEPAGGFRAFWLDGRAMLEGGSMAVRTARVDEGVVGESEVLDARVCECCQTSAALAAAGPLVVYRNRSSEEVRDIYVVRAAGEDWSEPAPVHGDGWVIPGCPVNGPAVAAEGEEAVVAWFTAADGTPRVRAAFSADGGATFGDVIEVDGPAGPGSPSETQAGAGADPAGPPPLGRVDVELLGDGTAVVSWLGGDGAVHLRRLAPDGAAGPPRRIATTSTARASGFPHIQTMGEGRLLAVTWVDPAEAGSRLRFATQPLSGLPAAPETSASHLATTPAVASTDTAALPGPAPEPPS